jgi:hypothetical protein
MPVDFASEYERALLEARARALGLSREAVQKIVTTFNRAIADIAKDVSDERITAARGDELARQVKVFLETIANDVTKETTRAVSLTVDGVIASHRAALTALEASSKVVGLLKQFDSISASTVGVIASRERNAATFRTLFNRHITEAADSLDELIGSAVARGVSNKVLTRDVARLLGGAEANYDELGIERTTATGLRSLYGDARMIAVSETNNALREANARSLVGSRVVETVHWQLSGAHGDKHDECDVLAETDWFGFGPGWFDVRQWPGGPHPFCGCYQGAVELRKQSDWKQPRADAPAGIQDGVEVFKGSEWTPKATTRMQGNATRIVKLAIAHPVKA